MEYVFYFGISHTVGMDSGSIDSLSCNKVFYPSQWSSKHHWCLNSTWGPAFTVPSTCTNGLLDSQGQWLLLSWHSHHNVRIRSTVLDRQIPTEALPAKMPETSPNIETPVDAVFCLHMWSYRDVNGVNGRLTNFIFPQCVTISFTACSLVP